MKPTGLRAFINWLAVQPVDSTVILIDEYDAPLTASLNDPELFERVRTRLSAFYAGIKNWDRAIRFLFMTGITKFSRTSIFSELNNVTDITLSPGYGTLLGYTLEEMSRCFSGHLDRASQALGLGREELIQELERHYDGFCFDRAASTRVFAPWSLLNFFNEPQSGLLDYWFESGGRPSALLQYLKSHALRDPENYAVQKSIALNALSSASDIETLSDIGLLTQAGYLTIRRVVGKTAWLDYPNAEVRTAMGQLYTEELLKGKSVEEAGAESAAVRLAQESPEEIVGLFNRFFHSLDYQHYPVRDEASVRAFVQAFLAGSGLDPRAEVHNSRGRSDLEVRAGSRLWIFEFKVQHQGEQAETLLREALEQIQVRRYGEESGSRELLRAALVFSLEERAFVRWAVCPENPRLQQNRMPG